jgi:hypothetical protein
MTTITYKVTIYSEDGDENHPASLELTLDGTQRDCPVTFWKDGKAVFSMGNDEIPAFIKALSLLDCSNT